MLTSGFLQSGSYYIIIILPIQLNIALPPLRDQAGIYCCGLEQQDTGQSLLSTRIFPVYGQGVVCS